MNECAREITTVNGSGTSAMTEGQVLLLTMVLVILITLITNITVGLFIWFVKWFSYIMITLIVIMFMNNWFDDGTGSMFMPDEIYEDQYDPQGLNKKKGI